jgi:hypothetical protein
MQAGFRRLLVLVVAGLGVAQHVLGSEPEITPVIHFGDPADAVRVTLTGAHLARVTGTRVNAGGIAAQVDFEAADWPELVIRPTGEPADWTGVQALTIIRQPSPSTCWFALMMSHVPMEISTR